MTRSKTVSDSTVASAPPDVMHAQAADPSQMPRLKADVEA